MDVNAYRRLTGERYLLLGGAGDGQWFETKMCPTWRVPIKKPAEWLKPPKYFGIEQPATVADEELYDDYTLCRYYRKDKQTVVVYVLNELVLNGDPIYDLVDMLMAGYRKAPTPPNTQTGKGEG